MFKSVLENHFKPYYDYSYHCIGLRTTMYDKDWHVGNLMTCSSDFATFNDDDCKLCISHFSTIATIKIQHLTLFNEEQL